MSMTPRIAILVDADHWPPTSLFALLNHARSKGDLQYWAAFGAFGTHTLEPWEAHFLSLKFEWQRAIGPNFADKALLDRAIELAPNFDELWIASKDKKLLGKIAAELTGKITLRVVENPESFLVPAGMELESIKLTRAPIPSEVRERLREAVRSAGGPAAFAFFSAVADQLHDIHYREFGRETLLDLFKEFPGEFAIEGDRGGGAVKIRPINAPPISG